LISKKKTILDKLSLNKLLNISVRTELDVQILIVVLNFVVVVG